MLQRILISNIFRVICFLMIALILQSCYSNFALKKPINQNLLSGKDISKIKLKDGKEIIFDGNRKMEFLNEEIILIKSSDGTQQKIAINSIDEINENKYDGEKTASLFQAIGGFVVIGGLFIATVAWIKNLAAHQ